MSYFKPEEGMIIQGVMTNISENHPQMLKIKERLKVLTFEQNPGLNRDKIDDYDKAFYHIANVKKRGKDEKKVKFNEFVNGKDVKGKRVRGKPVHLVKSKGYLVIETFPQQN